MALPKRPVPVRCGLTVGQYAQLERWAHEREWSTGVLAWLILRDAVGRYGQRTGAPVQSDGLATMSVDELLALPRLNGRR